MDAKDREFMSRLLATFKVEADEHVRAMAARLIELEQVRDAEQAHVLIEAIFRHAHSLKGAARSVNITEFERICHVLEDIFARWKQEEGLPPTKHFDVLHQAMDLLTASMSTLDGERTALRNASSSLVRSLKSILESSDDDLPGQEIPAQPSGMPPLPEPVASSSDAPATAPALSEGGVMPDTIRLSGARMAALLMEVEELLGAKLAAQERARNATGLWSEVQSIRRGHAAQRTDEADALSRLEHGLKLLATTADRDQRKLSALVDGLSQDLRRALMLPVGTLLEGLPRQCRELSRALGKDVELVSEGGALEIDRRILDEMRDPLLHMLRNCIDHGIEPGDERERAGKPSRGKLAIQVVQQEGNRLEWIIQDDGRGIDQEKLRAAALKSGVLEIAEAEALTLDDTLALAFRSGVSTSPLITDLSGRGLGLAIVQEKVERLGGTLRVQSVPGQGTSFHILLPSTLAAYRGVLVRAHDTDLLIPTTYVERVLRASREAVQSVEGRSTLRIAAESLSLAPLAGVLQLPEPRRRTPNNTHVVCVLVRAGAVRIAFEVDEIVAEQEVLAKDAGAIVSRVRHIAGIAMLGTGAAVPILQVNELLESAMTYETGRHAATVEDAELQVRRNVLVAEDSITARALLKNVLETAGYHVLVAVDGAEALALLRTEPVDLVISDVEMPRMNGFEFTARIRGDKRFSELPIILVTALESREDRERGIDAGANAYIVKSSFAQSNLLEVMRRLL